MRAADVKKAAWTLTRRKAWSGFTGLPNRLLDSPAFAALPSAAAVRTLIWFYQEARYEKIKKRPGVVSPIGRTTEIVNNGEISFTYQVAAWRGMNPRRFARVLKELHRLGFIDVAKLGRGVMGAYTKFSLGVRWQRYGTAEWEEMEFPENFKEGWRRRKKITDASVRLPTDANVRYEVVKSPDNGHKRPLKTAVIAHFQRTSTSVSKDLASPTRGPSSADPGLGDAGNDKRASRKPWRPPRSELRESVTEILRQRPDDRASDRRFVAMLVDTLDGAGRERLDPARVYRDLQDRHGLDKWHADLLFAVACIPTPEVRT